MVVMTRDMADRIGFDGNMTRDIADSIGFDGSMTRDIADRIGFVGSFDGSMTVVCILILLIG